MRPEAAPALVNEAFARLNGGRRGPVSLEMPMDIMGTTAEVELLAPARTPLAAPAVDTDRVEQAREAVSPRRVGR